MQEDCHNILSSQAKKLVVFIFVADWCPHSEQLKNHLEVLAKEDQHVVLVLIDVDDAEVNFYYNYLIILLLIIFK